MTWLLVIETFVLMPLALFGLCLRLVGSNSDSLTKFHNSFLFVISLGLGPLLISRILIWLFEVAPGREPGFYVALISAVIIALAICFARQAITTLGQVFKKTIWDRTDTGFVRVLNCLLLVTLAVTFSFSAFLAWETPLLENDPLKYATLARVLTNHRTTDFYPMEQADPATGFYVVTSHPLGFPGMISWSYLIQGSAEYSGLMKIIAPYYSFCTILLIFFLGAPSGALAGAISAMFFLLTPGYLYTVIINHLDPLRVFCFLAPFALVPIVRKRIGGATILLQGLVLGLGIFSHSSNILLLPLYGLVFLLFSEGAMLKKLWRLSLVIALASLVGAGQYLQNFTRYGSPVFDSFPIGALEQIKFNQYFQMALGIEQPMDRIFVGALRGITSFSDFGLSYWLFAASFIIWTRLSKELPFLRIGTLVTGTFYFVLLLSTLVGMDFFINSYRYILVLQPFIALQVGVWFALVFRGKNGS